MRMDRLWAEVKVAVAPAWADLVAAALNALGANGVVLPGDPAEAEGEWASPPASREAVVRAYFPVDDLLGERIATLRARLAEAGKELDLPPFAIALDQVAEADWAEAWKSHYHALRVGRVAVVPSWEKYTPAPDEAVVRLDPGLAFGAGTHPTTQQSLSLLQKHIRPGDRVLDIGTGCGVLAVAAAKLGAGSVLARDIDPVAVDVARGNVAANGLADMVEVEQGDLAAGLDGRFDLVLANLVAPFLLDLFPALPLLLAPGGRAIAAGVIRARAGEVVAAAAAAGLATVEEIGDGDWRACVFVQAVR